jgi:hypothetical protein
MDLGWQAYSVRGPRHRAYRSGGLTPKGADDALIILATARARAADSAADKVACEQALAEVQRAIGP